MGNLNTTNKQTRNIYKNTNQGNAIKKGENNEIEDEENLINNERNS